MAGLFERAFHHYRRIFVGARAVKGGLGEAALATPKIAFADQQALAKQRADNEFRQRAFVQFGVIEDEELLDVVGTIDEHPARAHDRHADDVAVLASETLQCAEGIAADLERETEDRQAFGARRRVGSVIRHFGRVKFISSRRNTQRKTNGRCRGRSSKRSSGERSRTMLWRACCRIPRRRHQPSARCHRCSLGFSLRVKSCGASLTRRARMSRKERCQRKSFPRITQKDCEEPKRRWPNFRLFWKYGGAGVRRLIHYQLKRGGVAGAA